MDPPLPLYLMSAISLRARNEAGVQRPDPIPETILPESRTGKSGAQKSMTHPTDCSQISPTFYEQLLHSYSFDKKFQSQPVIREKLHKTLSY